MYANPNVILKKQCFDEVANLARNIRMSWMVIGDFNEILMASEKGWESWCGQPKNIPFC